MFDTYGRRTSDTHITIESRFLNKVEPGVVVLAYKGFPGIRAFTKRVVVLPTFSKGNEQFTNDELQAGYHVAQMRVHVERSFNALKPSMC